MNEHPYKVEHLQDYTGILTSERSSGTFKMELKLEDNPVLERSVEKIESSIELEFKYNYGLSTLFFHDIHSCPSRFSQDESCAECDKMREIYDKFEANIYFLQIGDTFKIKAALMNNDRSVLPAEIHNFGRYQPLLAACTEYRLRLPDTIEGVNKKREKYFEKEERKAEEETKRLKEPFFNKLLDKLSPYFPGWLVKGVIVTVIGTFIGGTMLLMFGESIKKIIFTIF